MAHPLRHSTTPSGSAPSASASCVILAAEQVSGEVERALAKLGPATIGGRVKGCSKKENMNLPIQSMKR
ncbi:hypothetical protein RIF29_15655 [Crotalaria pallida]|uniref:Uncharacterized protein n=1 Tax=Crotalaria pallida TaxID=3830 RepID=A0AAN9FDZ1_CROPI